MIPLLTDIATRSGCTDAGLLAEVLADAARAQTSAVDAILDSASVDEERFTAALAESMGHPFWDGNDAPSDDRRLARLLPAEVALNHLILPLRLEKSGIESATPNPQSETLHLAVHDPFDLQGKRSLTKHLKTPVTFHLATRARIAEGLQALYGVGAVGLAYLPFLARLRRRTAVLFVIAGLVYVGGAVGVERWTGDDVNSLEYNMWTTLEEGLEMFGVILMIYAVLDHMRGGVENDLYVDLLRGPPKGPSTLPRRHDVP